MKGFHKELTFEIFTRRAFVNITSQVEQFLADSGVREGLCLVNSMRITASVFIYDDEHGLHQDFEKFLEVIAPHEPISSNQHNRRGECGAN